MKKITSLLFVMLLACVTNLQAGKITTVEGITSGKKYYIGATTSSKDYYLSVDGSKTSTNAVAGTAVADKTNAAVFTFTQNGDAWTIQFENGNYLSLSSNQANGKVVVSSEASTFTITNNTSKSLLTIACDNTKDKTYAIQKNNSGTQFGSYKKTQTDVWLEEYVEGVTVSSIAISGNATTTYKDGDAFDVTGLTVTATKSDASTEDVTKAVEWTVTPEVLTAGTTSVSVKATYAGKEATTNVNVTVLTLQALALSGEPENMTYYLGETFNPKGLVVTGTYSDGTTKADVTDQVEWDIDPATFTTVGTTSVDVMAYIGNDLMSNVLTINDVQVIDVDKYAKVTSAAQLADGQHIIIVDKDNASALSTTQNTNNRGAVKVTASESGLITPSSDVEIITLNAQDAQWELQVSGGYLYAASSSSNNLKTQTNNDANGQWTITIAEETGVATVKANGNYTRNVMRFNPNNGSPIFSCYASSSTTGSLVSIFARQYTVTVIPNDEEMGTVTGSGDYFENNVATLDATPKDGYKFTGWSNNSELTSTTQELTVTESVTITANFAKGETAIDNAVVETPVIKTIENGQLIILRDGVKYNAMGVRLQ